MRTVAVAWLALLSFASPAFAFRARVVDPQGRPVANATVSILGRTGEAITDKDGRFAWQPDPPTPFEILVIDAGGNYSKPILIEALDPSAELVVTVAPILSESVTVQGSAPSIESTPGAATSSLSGRDVAVRQPTNLMQAIENVAGVNQVSEGQAAVPAIRGLARGRTLILVDGARVSSERRAGASATFLDPSLIEGVDVSRGPGSVAYGSDAFGGVISVRTKRVMPGSPWAFQLSGSAGAGVPERRSRSPRGYPPAVCCSPRTRAKPTIGTARRARSSTPASAIAASWCAPSSRSARVT
jgi:iron complex outermembrane receptor protein